MIKRFRDYLIGELELFSREGILKINDVKKAADIIVTLMEGMEFHSHFLAEDKPFEEFADFAKKQVLAMLQKESQP